MKKAIYSIFVAIVWMSFTNAFAATSTSIEIRQGAEKLKEVLEAIPHAKIGKGPALYVFQFPDCPYCQGFYKDFGGNVPGFQTRHMFYAVSQKSANETATLATMPRPNMYHYYMRQSKQAEPYNKNQKRLDAYNSVMSPINDVILPTLIKNGWRSKSLVSPTFLWEENGKMYADGGYRRDHFETLVASIRKAYPAAGERAEQHSPDHAKSLHAHDGAPMKTTEVQGIFIGMPVKEAERIAQQKGYQKGGAYWYQDDGQSRKSLWLGAGAHTREGKVEPFIAHIKYQQQFKPEIQFPLESFRDAVLKKYGRPLNEVKRNPGFGNYAFSYYPPNPDRGAVEAACTEEMNRNGVKLDRMGIGSLHPMNQRVFLERGEREISAKCPSQLEAHRRLIDYEWGVWGSVGINPRTKEFVIEVTDHGAGQWKWRHIHEEKLQKQDSGPVGTVDL